MHLNILCSFNLSAGGAGGAGAVSSNTSFIDIGLAGSGHPKGLGAYNPNNKMAGNHNLIAGGGGGFLDHLPYGGRGIVNQHHQQQEQRHTQRSLLSSSLIIVITCVNFIVDERLRRDNYHTQQYW